MFRSSTHSVDTTLSSFKAKLLSSPTHSTQCTLFGGPLRCGECDTSVGYNWGDSPDITLRADMGPKHKLTSLIVVWDVTIKICLLLNVFDLLALAVLCPEL